MPVMITGGGTPSERSIRGDLNKLAPGNYQNIARRLRFASDIDNLTFIFRTALEKAYLEPEHGALYINLFADLLESLGAEAREIAVGIVRGEMPTEDVIMREALGPRTDPAKDYDRFCEACRVKRRIVGRSATFAGLLDVAPISRSLEATPRDVYDRHERVMRDIIGEGLDEDPDIDIDRTGAVEIMIDSLGTVVRRRSDLRRAFRASIDELDIRTFPSSKCRFKIMDILGR